MHYLMLILNYEIKRRLEIDIIQRGYDKLKSLCCIFQLIRKNNENMFAKKKSKLKCPYILYYKRIHILKSNKNTI